MYKGQAGFDFVVVNADMCCINTNNLDIPLRFQLFASSTPRMTTEGRSFQDRRIIVPPEVKELVKESKRSLIPSLSSRILPKSKSPLDVLVPISIGRVCDSSAERPLPTTSRIPDIPRRIRSSSSVNKRPAPFPVDASSVSTDRLRGASEGSAKSKSWMNAGEGGIAVIIGVAVVAVNPSDVVAERDRTPDSP